MALFSQSIITPERALFHHNIFRRAVKTLALFFSPSPSLLAETNGLCRGSAPIHFINNAWSHFWPALDENMMGLNLLVDLFFRSVWSLRLSYWATIPVSSVEQHPQAAGMMVGCHATEGSCCCGTLWYESRRIYRVLMSLLLMNGEDGWVGFYRKGRALWLAQNATLTKNSYRDGWNTHMEYNYCLWSRPFTLMHPLESLLIPIE